MKYLSPRGFLKNSFTEVSSMYKELHIINVYKLMSSDICEHPWYHQHNQGNRQSQHFLEFPCAPLFLFSW